MDRQSCGKGIPAEPWSPVVSWFQRTPKAALRNNAGANSGVATDFFSVPVSSSFSVKNVGDIEQYGNHAPFYDFSEEFTSGHRSSLFFGFHGQIVKVSN
jgi:hypothetical protein